MFEPNMDEYLEEEIEHLKMTLETTCVEWDRKVIYSTASYFNMHYILMTDLDCRQLPILSPQALMLKPNSSRPQILPK